MTITSPDTVKSILLNGCQDEGLKFPVIYAYKGANGQQDTQFALFTDPAYDDIYQSPYVDHESVVLLASSGILTIEGQTFVDSGLLPESH